MQKGFFKGVILGAIALGITALLFAPKSGKKLRKDLQNSYKDLKEGADEVIQDLKKHSREFTKDTKKKAKNFLRKNRDMRSK